MVEKEDIILVGGGGHCKACIDVIESENKYRIVGIIDVPDKYGHEILGYRIIGNDNDIPNLAKKGHKFLITVGHIGNPNLRIKLFNIVKENGGVFPTIISPLSYVSKYANIYEGTIIMHHVVVNTDAQIGKNCIINTKALIEHDARIEDNVHISTAAIVNGNCIIGKQCLVGSASIVKQSVIVVSDTSIGAGAVVVNDINNSGIYVGIPAKKR